MKPTLLVLASCFLAMTPVSGQRKLVEQKAPDSNEELAAVALPKPVKPAFLISPLVQRLSARRGQLVRIEYEIESNLKPTRLEVSVVGMRQEENGVILPDPTAVTENVMQLLTPATVVVKQGEKTKIRCQVRVPVENNPFLTFGVLVREVPDSDQSNPNNSQPVVGIRFVTQYLLRADIEVIGVRGDSVKQLQIESARLVEKEGAAVMNVAINNPTPSAMEYQLRTKLKSIATGKFHRSKLYVPVRANQDEPERYDARILGNTRLQMEGLLNESVFPGDYTVQVEMLYKGRVYNRKEFPVTIKSGDFPAQDATIVRVARDIMVEPATVELSLRRGGARMRTFTIENGSQQKIIARLSPKKNIGDLAEWISFRPEVLELESGQKRKVLVTLGSKRDFTEHSYAFATVQVSPEVGKAIGTHDIPIGLLTNSESNSKITPEGLAWDSSDGRPGFQVPIVNTGKRHLEVFARLQMRDEFGRGFVMEDGYGRWLLPGMRDKLKFTFPRTPPPGTYEMLVEIQQGEGRPNIQMNQTIRLKPTLDEISELPGATDKK